MRRRAAALPLIAVFLGATLTLSQAIRLDAGPAVAPPAVDAAGSATPQGDPELQALGKATYEKQCAACHGAGGRGDGEAAYLLYPKPRDLTQAAYRLISTWERTPTDQDLFDTISRGMPGSAMPSWDHLPERTRRGLVQYVRTLADQPWETKPSNGKTPDQGTPTGVITVPPEPPYDAAAREKAKQMFAEACAGCHGPTGRGDGVEEQFDDKGYPTRPRDLTLGVFKGRHDGDSLYRRIVAGMPGTPMPMSDWSYGEDAWHLVHFVRSLSSDAQRARVEMKKFTILTPRVASLPDHPDSSLWNQATPVNLHLMPLWWRSERPEELTVRALHDGKDVALLLTWLDATFDHTAIRVQDFRDAAAVELSPAPDPPFFAMGAKGQFVNIWMWKSERQADLDPAFQDLDKVYPNIGIDSYPNSMRSALEQPARGALTLQSDPVYVTGWGAGNIVSNPAPATPAEDLQAQGFGTLTARPKAGNALVARGVYGTDSYRVIFRRSLKLEEPGAVRLRPGSTVPVAFAVWNGSAGDRNGKKSVTIWQELKLAP